ncbi:MAG: hypothetical protein BWK73_26845 [Thiothrix lacustris]|uniref:Excisionase n=1 Tax=Thiothrix lacustris TaxID=525917 RepID=A0A1Y1QKH7_9GAMM|nr:MAG: hypothetical protein BWK73_26845 [Thiothrix lacustris]
MSKWIDIEEWAKHNLPSITLTRATLTRYAKGQMFTPAARKIGRVWHVKDDAELVGKSCAHIEKPTRRKIDDPTVARIFASA